MVEPVIFHYGEMMTVIYFFEGEKTLNNYSID